MSKPTIDELFTDSGPFDEAVVISTLKPFITIQKASKEIFFKGGTQTTERRILLYGLAKKLLRAKGLIDSELITAQELHEKTGIKKGTIDPAFKRLRDSGYLVGKAAYEIPTARVSDAIEMLNKQKKS